MREHAAPMRVRDQILVSLAAAAAAIITLLVGRGAFSIFATLVLLVAYTDLRGLLGERGHISTLALGAGGVGAIVWAGYVGNLDRLPVFVGVLVIALLVVRVVLNEAGVQTASVTADLAATLGAAGLVGVLGAHVLLLRAIPRAGFRGLLALGLMVGLHDAVAFFVGRVRGRHVLNTLIGQGKTWEGALAGVAAATLVGFVVGLVLDPPFTIASGIAFGAGAGVFATVGDLCFSAIKRSAGVRQSGSYLGGAGGVLDLVDSLVFTAPAFYWAFRTIAL